MKIMSVDSEVLAKALEDVNAIFDDNIKFKRYDCNLNKRRDGRYTFHVTLTVKDSSGEGSRRSPHSWRKIAAACWHVYGEFFDAIAEHDPDALMVHPNDRHVRKVEDHGWEDRNIGSQFYPAMYSEACEC